MGRARVAVRGLRHADGDGRLAAVVSPLPVLRGRQAYGVWLVRIGPHTHPCFRYKTPVECCGDIVQNVDGVPPFTCRDYHLSDGTVAGTFYCDACVELVSDEDEDAA